MVSGWWWWYIWKRGAMRGTKTLGTCNCAMDINYVEYMVKQVIDLQRHERESELMVLLLLCCIVVDCVLGATYNKGAVERAMPIV